MTAAGRTENPVAAVPAAARRPSRKGLGERLLARLVPNDWARKRWSRLLAQRRVVLSALLLVGLSGASFTAELWSNSKPWVLRSGGEWFFPVLKDYHPTRFGVTDRLLMDYRALELAPERGDFAIWPPNRWDPFESNKAVESYPSRPTSENLLGTDDRGRDILARLLYGFRYSIGYAVLVWVITVIAAIGLGGAMGFFGGWVDLVGQRLVEVLNTVPVFFLLIILVSVFDPSLPMLVALTSLFSWIGLSYYVRGEFLRNRKADYVESARAVGAKTARLIFRHILPNSLVPVITFSPFIISAHILGLASLDYLGFGLKPPTPSWGELLHQAQKNFTTAWWLATFPALALFVALLLLSIVGDGVRRAFDPKRG
jgi:microcin C transport system permease protein